jgi:GxxExxY protein
MFTAEAQRALREVSFWLSGDADKQKTYCPLGKQNYLLMNVELLELNNLTGNIIGAAIEVHKILGPGLLESVYEECLCYEFVGKGISFERQRPLPIKYKEVTLDCGYRLDIVAENTVIIELKSCEKIEDIHRAQLLTYLKLSGLKVGLLMNFNVPFLRDGIVRIVNNLEE